MIFSKLAREPATPFSDFHSKSGGHTSLRWNSRRAHVGFAFGFEKLAVVSRYPTRPFGTTR